MSWSGTPSGRCVDSGNTRSHAHLIGGNWVDKNDLAPSAVLCVVSFLAIAAVAWTYRETKVHLLLLFAFALLFLGIAFAIHAALANARPSARGQSAVACEQAFFLLALSLLLLGHILFARTFINRASLVHWPSTLLYLACALLLAAFIVGCVALGDLPPLDPYTYSPPLKYTQERIASAVLELIVATMHPLLLPFAKLVAPELPGLELGLLVLAGWFLWVPALYVFCLATITADASPLVCSQTFFYLAFFLFPFLALAILLGLPLHRWGFTLPPRDLVTSYSYAAPAATHAALAHEAAELGEAAAWAQQERRHEADEGALLDEMRSVVGENAERAGLYDDDAWSLRLH
ncbi:uncharacterized protein RHOBADRAFT_40824 [Rhodotorula graminis WP1]|uniref:Chitin synthase export chaperone n=1 Tax=Rhodotorula graminis (strain WP1) TaxID=578459 RepID=A0A194SCE6_RHOGW|nr:uncharacterized protein RHOBADRAFT_40824 [Rhodotorula graminis WP1]KPV78277.1 hypothetical protein RHOBADRAFT_40824 [Rhodotorula graminis WP1]